MRSYFLRRGFSVPFSVELDVNFIAVDAGIFTVPPV